MKFEDITSDIAPLSPADDGRHALRKEALARESLVFTLQLPEEKIAGWVYPRVGSDGKAAGVFAVFGDGVPGGPIYEVFHDIAVPDSMNFTQWRVAGVELDLTNPLRTAHVKYASQRLTYDFTFEAIHPAYGYHSHPDGCPQYFADNRFEQSGRVKGTVTIDGRAIPFDVLGQRDHSWGTRNWGVNYHYKWFHATTPDSAVHFFKMDYLGRSLTRGYVFKDGHFSQLKEANVIDFTLDEDMIHTDIVVELHDLAGRTTRVSGRRFAHQPLPVTDHGVTLNEVAMIIEIDGKPGTGWCEFQWDDSYLAHMKQFKHIRR
ncbi:MAG: hypothetical protein M0P39_13730 [Rhodocyclaceae bacterium]|nr:hypothetical protein [Rhodocyclaceae bacterium]